MKTITVEQIIALRPCSQYPPEQIIALAAMEPGKERWTALEVLAREDIPAVDRLWLVHREDLVDAPVLHEAACRYAERALARLDKPDQVSIDLLATKRRWVRGEVTDEELRDAWRAAEIDAWNAAEIAAWRAAWRDAWYAAQYAAQSAAQCAAWSTASRAAEGAECEAQVAILRELLESAA